jgi:hypothetical protein
MGFIVHNAPIVSRDRADDHSNSGAFSMVVPYKIRVKIGVNEFEAEGPENVVKEQFSLFMEISKASPLPNPRQESVNRDTGRVGNENGTVKNLSPEITEEMLNRIFVVDQEDQVSLRILPRTTEREADTLLVLLYGYRKLLNQNDVLVGKLGKAARTSGIQFERIDYAIAPNLELVTKGGARVGARYGLNNRGMTRAEEIIAETLG